MEITDQPHPEKMMLKAYAKYMMKAKDVSMDEARKDTAKFARREGIPKDTKPFKGQSLAGMSDLLDQAIAASKNKQKADHLARVKERGSRNKL